MRARALAEELVEFCREVSDPWNAANSCRVSAFVELLSGDFVKARSWSEESLVLYKEVGDTHGVAYSLLMSGSAVFWLGEQAKGRSLLEESLVLFKEVGDRRGLAWVLYSLGVGDLVQGDYTAARAHHEQSLALLRELDHQWLITLCLDGLAGAVSLQGHATWAARLWGAAEVLGQTIGVSLPSVIRILHEQLVAAARDQLGERAFAAAWAEGRTQPLEQVIDEEPEMGG